MANQNQVVLVDPMGYAFVLELRNLDLDIRGDVGVTMVRNYGKANEKAFQTQYAGTNDALRFPNLSVSLADLATLIAENPELKKYIIMLLMKAANPYLIDEEIKVQKGTDPEVVEAVDTARKVVLAAAEPKA